MDGKKRHNEWFDFVKKDRSFDNKAFDKAFSEHLEELCGKEDNVTSGKPEADETVVMCVEEHEGFGL